MMNNMATGSPTGQQSRGQQVCNSARSRSPVPFATPRDAQGSPQHSSPDHHHAERLSCSFDRAPPGTFPGQGSTPRQPESARRATPQGSGSPASRAAAPRTSELWPTHGTPPNGSHSPKDHSSPTANRPSPARPLDPHAALHYSPPMGSPRGIPVDHRSSPATTSHGAEPRLAATVPRPKANDDHSGSVEAFTGSPQSRSPRLSLVGRGSPSRSLPDGRPSPASVPISPSHRCAEVVTLPPRRNDNRPPPEVAALSRSFNGCESALRAAKPRPPHFEAGAGSPIRRSPTVPSQLLAEPVAGSPIKRSPSLQPQLPTESLAGSPNRRSPSLQPQLPTEHAEGGSIEQLHRRPSPNATRSSAESSSSAHGDIPLRAPNLPSRLSPSADKSVAHAPGDTGGRPHGIPGSKSLELYSAARRTSPLGPVRPSSVDYGVVSRQHDIPKHGSPGNISGSSPRGSGSPSHLEIGDNYNAPEGRRSPRPLAAARPGSSPKPAAPNSHLAYPNLPGSPHRQSWSPSSPRSSGQSPEVRASGQSPESSRASPRGLAVSPSLDVPKPAAEPVPSPKAQKSSLLRPFPASDSGSTLTVPKVGPNMRIPSYGPDAFLRLSKGSLHPACPKCGTFVDDGDGRPLTLKCGHSFCASCCQNMIEDDIIQCPSCKKPTELHGQGMKALSTNYAFSGLGELPMKELHRRSTLAILDDIGATCPICFEGYHDNFVPCMLSCGHSMCKECSEQNKETCPACGAKLEETAVNKPLQKALEALVAWKRQINGEPLSCSPPHNTLAP